MPDPDNPFAHKEKLTLLGTCPGISGFNYLPLAVVPPKSLGKPSHLVVGQVGTFILRVFVLSANEGASGDVHLTEVWTARAALRARGV